MALYCNKCKNKLILVSGTFYFEADEEPYESGERIKLTIEGEEFIHGHYCDKCKSFEELWGE